MWFLRTDIIHGGETAVQFQLKDNSSQAQLIFDLTTTCAQQAARHSSTRFIAALHFDPLTRSRSRQCGMCNVAIKHNAVGM